MTTETTPLAAESSADDLVDYELPAELEELTSNLEAEKVRAMDRLHDLAIRAVRDKETPSKDELLQLLYIVEQPIPFFKSLLDAKRARFEALQVCKRKAELRRASKDAAVAFGEFQKERKRIQRELQEKHDRLLGEKRRAGGAASVIGQAEQVIRNSAHPRLHRAADEAREALRLTLDPLRDAERRLKDAKINLERCEHNLVTIQRDRGRVPPMATHADVKRANSAIEAAKSALESAQEANAEAQAAKDEAERKYERALDALLEADK